MRGFKMYVRKDIDLTGGSIARADAHLEVGNVTESVNVTAAGA
jgi:hypothetical protein